MKIDYDNSLTFQITIPSRIITPAIWLLLLYRRIRYRSAFRRIPLTQRKFAIVDHQNFRQLAEKKWYAARNGRNFYAVRTIRSKKTKKRITIQMHNLILNVPPGFVVDHKNGNGLDNRIQNLRPATYAQNSANTRSPKFKITSSRYRGVHWHKKKKKWVAAIMHKNKRIYLGQFKSEYKAAKEYDIAARKLHEKFATLNFKS